MYSSRRRQQGLEYKSEYRCLSRLVKVSRGDRIRTCDLVLPKHPRYQAAPRPVSSQLKGLRGQGLARPGRVASVETNTERLGHGAVPFCRTLAQ
jgi:hypothetical protein